MNKDVIYIDVEDDITAIISKVKASKEKIVALVPPKRVGVLQSAVNLRLLSRASSQADKRLVLITNNHALMSLAASASLPVAKNLQSKPELAEISAIEIDDDDDVIDGNDLPIGDHAKQAGEIDDDTISSAALSAALAEPPKTGEAPKKAKPKSGVKIPNFNTFRKKMIIGIIALIVFIVFLVWAIFIAPRATVIVSAKTDNSSVNAEVKIGDALVTSLEKNTIKAVVMKDSEDKSVEFTATGTKNVGEKSSGTVEFSKSTPGDQLISGGSQLKTSGGLVFITSSDVTVPGATLSFSCQPDNLCPGSASVAVIAAEGGAKYNAASGSLSGTPSDVSASFSGATSGGTDKIAKVVTAGDVQTAKEKLVKNDTDATKMALKDKFEDDVKVIDDSFAVDYTKVVSTPAIGTEAPNGKAVLTSTVEYSLYAVPATELDKYLDAYLKEEIGSADDRRVYSNGEEKASIQDVTKTKTGADVTLVATAKVGPKLDEGAIKDQVQGKKFGDIQESIEAIQGVESVDVKLFPFWVSTVPNDLKRINVVFKVDDAN